MTLCLVLLVPPRVLTQMMLLRGNLTPNSAGVRMGFVAPIVTKQHREQMKRYFNLTEVPSPADVIELLNGSPFLKGEICVHIGGQLCNPKAMIDKMCGTDVLFFKDTTSTNVVAHMVVHKVTVGCGHTHDNVAIVVDDEDEDEDDV